VLRSRGGHRLACDFIGQDAERCATSRCSGGQRSIMEEQNMRKTIAKAFLTAFLLASAAAALSACNTTEGAGKDISNAGKAISNEAQKDK
jgi:predicted small secreted protein